MDTASISATLPDSRQRASPNYLVVVPHLPDIDCAAGRPCCHVALVRGHARCAPHCAHGKPWGPKCLPNLKGASVHQLQQVVLASGQNLACRRGAGTLCDGCQLLQLQQAVLASIQSLACRRGAGTLCDGCQTATASAGCPCQQSGSGLLREAGTWLDGWHMLQLQQNPLQSDVGVTSYTMVQTGSCAGMGCAVERCSGQMKVPAMTADITSRNS